MDKADNLEAADISKDDGKSKSEAVERKKVRVTVQMSYTGCFLMMLIKYEPFAQAGKHPWS